MSAEKNSSHLVCCLLQDKQQMPKKESRTKAFPAALKLAPLGNWIPDSKHYLGLF